MALQFNLLEQLLLWCQAAVGFCDAKYLSHRFKAVVGMTPSEYRAASRTEAGGR